MSGFDDNPFGDSPFQDPSIKQATATAGNDLEDYNPFGDQPQRPTTVPISAPAANNDSAAVRGAANPPQYGAAGSFSPAVMSPTQEPTVYGKPNPAPISTEELQRRQEELERKARELERREEELRNQPFNARKNNWPPLPEFLPVQPCFYQDINVDIPVEFQRIVRYIYYAWIYYSGLLLINCLVCLLRLLFVSEEYKFQRFIISIIFIIIFVPMSYTCWFRPAYKAFRSDSSFNFMVFFLIFFFQALMNVYFAIGFSGGACGIVDAAGVLAIGGASSIVVGICTLIVAAGFVVNAGVDAYLLIRVHRIYRSTGASFDKARQEFTTGVMRNEQVQSAATSFASEAIRAQVSNMTSPGGQNSSRY